MSAQPQYVYIPNLVGRQMLRIPVLPYEELEDLDADDQIEIMTGSSSHLTFDTTTPTTSSYTRDASPTPSEESVQQAE